MKHFSNFLNKSRLRNLFTVGLPLTIVVLAASIFSSCASAKPLGALTITGIPEEYEGKYASFNTLNTNGVYFKGPADEKAPDTGQSLFAGKKEEVNHPPIANGETVLDLYKKKVFLQKETYTGAEPVDITVIISDTSWDRGTTSPGNPFAIFEDVVLTEGNASINWAAAKATGRVGGVILKGIPQEYTTFKEEYEVDGKKQTRDAKADFIISIGKEPTGVGAAVGGLVGGLMGMAGVDAGPPFNAEVTDNYVNIKDGTLTTSGLWRGVFDEQDAGKAIQVSIGRQPYCESGTKDILIRIQTGTKEVEVFGQKQEMPIYADFVINDVEVVDGMAIGEVTKLTINKSGQSSITTRWEKVDKFIAPNAQASSVVAEPAVEPEAEPEAEASEEPVPESEDEPSTETVEESAVEPEAEESAEEGAES